MRLLALLCLGAALRVYAEAAPPAAPDPTLSIRHAPARLSVVGSASSRAHESILRDTVRRYYGDGTAASASFELERAGTPPGWALVTDQTLRALSFTQSATAEISRHTVAVRGVTSASPQWRAAARRIEESLLSGMRFRDEVIAIDAETDFTAACHRQLAELADGRRVEFAATSDALRPSSLALLDAVAELAAECRPLTLHVIGHTDHTGNETENRALSLARAEAVIDYVVARGVARSRTLPEGAGSARPLAPGEDRRARRLNRRVEFRFSAPDETL